MVFVLDFCVHGVLFAGNINLSIYKRAGYNIKSDSESINHMCWCWYIYLDVGLSQFNKRAGHISRQQHLESLLSNHPLDSVTTL